MPKLSGSLIRSGDAAPGRRTLIVLLCASIVLVTLYSREGAGGPVHTLRSAAHVVATPFTWLGSQVTAPFDALGRAFTNATAGEQTLLDLKAENTELSAQLAELNEYKLENERLRQMLDLASAYGTSGTAARVVGASTDDWSRTLTVDKGSSDGVAPDMPVTDGGAVVGQVTEVSTFSSTVTLLSDPGYGVGALLQNSRATGVLEGSVDGSLHLNHVPTSADVAVGELVVTSGLGGAYPKGMLLGRVASVVSSPSDVYYSIVVEPAVSPGTYEELYIVTSFDAAVAEGAAEQLLTTGSPTGAADGGEALPVEDGTPAEGDAASGDGAPAVDGAPAPEGDPAEGEV